MRISEVIQTDQIEQLIDGANFTEEDRDIGTAGLCGTFALVLYRILLRRKISSVLCLVCTSKDGKSRQTKNGLLMWKHACVRVQNNYYDVEGRVLPQQ